MQMQTHLPLRIQAATNNTAVLWAPILAHETGTSIGHVTQFPLGLQAMDFSGKNLEQNVLIGACLVVQRTRQAVRE
jgi:hypothetical protein